MKASMIRASGPGASSASPARKATTALKAFESRDDVRGVFERIQRNPAYTVEEVARAFAKVKPRK